VLKLVRLENKKILILIELFYLFKIGHEIAKSVFQGQNTWFSFEHSVNSAEIKKP